MTDRKNEPVQLPEPWENIPIGKAEMEALRAFCRPWALSYDYSGVDEGRPTPESESVWVMAMNSASGVRLAILLGAQEAEERVRFGPNEFPMFSPYRTIERLVVFPSQDGNVTSTDVKSIPLVSIKNAYDKVYGSGSVEANRTFLLQNPQSNGIPEKYWQNSYGGEIGQLGAVYPPTSILDSLPVRYAREPWFYALVASQYDAIAEKYPNANAANKMVEINSDVAPGSVRRWITKARKMGLLLPADWKHGDSDAA